MPGDVGVTAGLRGVKGEGRGQGRGLSSHVIKVYLTIDLSSTIESGFVAPAVRTIRLYLQSWKRKEVLSDYLVRHHNGA